jgi:hypothetical protein
MILNVMVNPCDIFPLRNQTIAMWIPAWKAWTFGYYDGEKWLDCEGEMPEIVRPTYWVKLPELGVTP